MAPRITVINSDRDTIEGLATALRDSGYTVSTLCTRGKSHDEVADFLRDEDPIVIVYDIGPPYTAAMAHWENLRRSHEARGKSFVLTTTGRGIEVGRFGEKHTELIEKPCGFDEVTAAVDRAVMRALRSR